MFRVTFAPTAIRSWNSLPRWAQRRFDEAFDRLGRNPRAAGLDFDIHQLYGYRNVWTLRIPPYRGIYVIEGEEVVMIVFGHRNSVYVQLHGLIPPNRRRITRTSVERAR